ncbi:hypothetical protein LZ31DRAFT_70138 [Colletotrichum somersetense]|nr:hypothetical protein LZ31DRAFT_70138 [Colletotrichum somersetense]
MSGGQPRAGSVFPVPVAEEVRDILAPWRPRISKITHQYLIRGNQHVILRAHYNQDGDDKMVATPEDGRGW